MGCRTLALAMVGVAIRPLESAPVRLCRELQLVFGREALIWSERLFKLFVER